DALIWASTGIQLARKLPQLFQVAVADLSFAFLENRVALLFAADPLDLALQVRVQIRSLAIEVGKQWIGIQPMRDLIRRFRIFRHHEYQRLLLALLPFLFRFLPA